MPIEYKIEKEKLISTAEEKGIIKIREDRVEYSLAKKRSYSYSGPEESVRARVIAELIFEFKYPKKRIDTEVMPPRRQPKLPADIVLYEDDELENAYLVVETKASSDEKEIEVAKREGLGNANLLDAKYLMVACGEIEEVYNIESHPSTHKALEKYRTNLPVAYGKEPKYRFKKGSKEFFDLREASLNELNTKFQQCHDEIWEGGRRDPAVAFDEMSKLMFAKMYDERFTKIGKYYNFQIGKYEEIHTIADRVKELYKLAQSKEPGVFTGELRAPYKVINRVVDILQDISLTKTDLDAKGRAFEKFLGKFFRGEYGQYFTPREIVEFMVNMLEPTENDLVIDPACGSGGFLLYCMKLVRDKIKKDYGGDEKSIGRIDYDFSHNQIFGIEINDRIARIAMMDMVIHEDGHSNIECHDALDDYKNFDPKKDIHANKFSLLLTNPPFGAVVKDDKILKTFELGSKLKKRNSQKTEILFIERSLDLIKEGERMGIVLPDGILTNTSLQYVRDFIERKAKFFAVISLPQTTFKPFGSGVKASLVFLKKKKEGKKLGDYPIFMAIVEHVGYDATGRPDKNDFPAILEDWEKFKRGELSE